MGMLRSIADDRLVRPDWPDAALVRPDCRNVRPVTTAAEPTQALALLRK